MSFWSLDLGCILTTYVPLALILPGPALSLLSLLHSPLCDSPSSPPLDLPFSLLSVSVHFPSPLLCLLALLKLNSSFYFPGEKFHNFHYILRFLGLCSWLSQSWITRACFSNSLFPMRFKCTHSGLLLLRKQAFCKRTSFW